VMPATKIHPCHGAEHVQPRLFGEDLVEVWCGMCRNWLEVWPAEVPAVRLARHDATVHGTPFGD
jgi:hypothetical protein